MKTVIISAFPGTGKTYFCAHTKELFKERRLKVMDSDSSTFDKSEFPANYIQHIKDHLGKVDVIFVSSHAEVKQALDIEKLDYVLVLPDLSLKSEYVARYIERGSPKGLIEAIEKNWEKWIIEARHYTKNETQYTLGSGAFIDRVVQDVLGEHAADESIGG